MRITSLVENTSRTGLSVEHGLSLHIHLNDGRQILFDMGQHRLFADNAERLGISLADVDMAVVSHGHYDHGGGLRTFLELNEKAKVYISQYAFEPHYSLRDEGLRYIGIDPELKANDRLVFCKNEVHIDNGIILFSGVNGDCLKPAGNRLLFGPDKDINDDFRHEQSLIIKEGQKTVLFAGCAHKGIMNIIQRGMHVAGNPFTHVLAGMHLVKSGLSEEEASKVVVAYEPIWAIGTGKSASSEIAEGTILMIRNVLRDMFGETAEDIRILYGGSVKPGNVRDYMGCPDIDGALVGGASLDPESYRQLLEGMIG